MTIHELLAAAGLTANDEIPIWDAEATGEPTKKITAQQLAAAVVTLAAVSKSGDTMTGNLAVEHVGDTYVIAKNTRTGVPVYLDSGGSGSHGIYSGGYYNGSTFVSDEKYLIYRNTDGKVIVADHYNKAEVNARGVLYEDVNIGNVTVGSNGWTRITSYIPTDITPIAALIQNYDTATGAITVTANGAFIMGAPNTTVTDVTIRYYYRGQ